MENIQKNQTKKITPDTTKPVTDISRYRLLLLSETEAYTCHGIKSLNGVTSHGYVILIQ